MDVKQVITIELTTDQLMVLIAQAVSKALNLKSDKENDKFIDRGKAAELLDCSLSYLDNCKELKKYKNPTSTLSRYKKSEVMAHLKFLDGF